MWVCGRVSCVSSNCFFFFSSRRRHTRCSRDWSSDVCSSDLAIWPIGRAKQQVYWYVGGYFTTSRYYADSLPEWVRGFNGRRIPFKAAGATWSLLLPARAYPEPDSEPYENAGNDFTFPHRLSPDSALAALGYLAVPSMDSLTLAFALEGVRTLGLGSRGAVDLLSVSLSTTDYVGHTYGPDSREIHDQVVRLDRTLGLFLQQLFVRYGSGNVLIVLTADHGVTPFPERSRADGHRDAQRVNVDTMIAAVNAQLDERAGGSAWVAFESGMVLLPRRAELAAQGVNVDSVITDVAGRARGGAGGGRGGPAPPPADTRTPAP